MSVPWWQSFFDETYLRLWSHLHPPEQSEAEARTILSLLRLAPGDRLLDAPCGYGRLSLPLARLGLEVTGVDYSEALLRHAERERDDGLALRYQRADMRSAELGEGYKAAINLFSSIGYGTEQEDEQMLRAICRALAPGGRLLLETIHRDVIVHRRSSGEQAGLRGPAGMTLREKNRFDPIRGEIHSTWTWNSPTESGSKRSVIRIYSATELIALVRRAGFGEVLCYCGISDRPWSEDTLESRLGLVCTKP